MAGLICDLCEQPTRVLRGGAVGTDAAGNLIYRRYRTCSNPHCPLYKKRRVSVEVFVDDASSSAETPEAS